MTTDNRPPKLGDLMPPDYGEVLRKKHKFKHRASIYRIVNSGDVTHAVYKDALKMAEEYQKEIKGIQAQEERLFKSTAA